MRLANSKSFFLLTLFAIVSIPNASSQEVPHQIQEFFQKYVVKPLEDRVNKKVAEFSGIINHYINPSPTNNSSGSTNETLPQLPADISLINGSDTYLPSNNNNTDTLQLTELIEKLLPSNGDTSTTDEAEYHFTTKVPPSISDDVDTNNTQKQSDTKSISSRSASASQDTLLSDAVSTIKGLCPELASRPDEVIQSEWRYFEPQNQCFRLSRRGPCGLGMILYPQDVGSIYSFCDCLPRDNRMVIYDNETNACYPIFTQGNCKQDEWIDLTRSGDPICTTNPCEKNGTGFVWFKDTCVQVDNQPSEKCEGNGIVGFVKARRTPVCCSSTGCPHQTVQTGPAPCPPGSYQAIHGKCHVSNWDFGDED